MATLRIRSSVESTVSVTDSGVALPSELFQPSYTKATKALLFVILILTTGYVGLALAPWYVLPIGWLIVGTAITGLVSVANDCERQVFVKSKFLNNLLGMVVLIPVWLPFNTLSESASSGSWLNWGPLWLLRSLWFWVKANFAIPVTTFLGGNSLNTNKKQMVVNLLCLYAFICVFFPIMTMTVGLWGIFKYYIIPMCVYHFWMSTCLKLGDQAATNPLSLTSFPFWVEFLGNNFNQLGNSVAKFREQNKYSLPSYNLKAARKALRERYDAYQEVNFGVETFLGSNNTNQRIVMKIHEHWYDLTSFNHPGGPIALNLGVGRDATALFYGHHPFTSKNKMDAILNKYRIPEENLDKVLSGIRTANETEETFDWDATFPENEASFAKDLISEVRTYFESQAKKRGISLLEATKATPTRWAEMIIFGSLFLALVPFYVQGYWFTVIALPIAAWLAAAAIVHDAMHFAISTNWKINFLFSYVTPWTASPLMWYHQHVIGHHAYPNIPFKDPDLAHAPGFMRLHTSVRWKPVHKFQMITLGFIWTLGAAMYMTIVPIKALCLGALNRSVKLLNISTTRKIIHVLGRLFVVLLLWGWQWYVFQGDLARQILFTAVPMMIHSLCFMISTQFNHLTPENAAASSNEYYTHQVVTSHSFSMKSQFVFWLTGGLNVQIEHHLFPAVNHCHLRQISPIVVRLCKKYSIPYHESTSIFQALSKHFAHVVNMSHK